MHIQAALNGLNGFKKKKLMMLGGKGGEDREGIGREGLGKGFDQNILHACMNFLTKSF